jgi:hypothetical protein
VDVVLRSLRFGSLRFYSLQGFFSSPYLSASWVPTYPPMIWASGALSPKTNYLTHDADRPPVSAPEVKTGVTVVHVSLTELINGFWLILVLYAYTKICQKKCSLFCDLLYMKL